LTRLAAVKAEGPGAQRVGPSAVGTVSCIGADDFGRSSHEREGAQMSTVYVSNLPVDVQEELLRKMFADYGPVRSIRLVRNGVSLRATSDCFLKLDDRRQAAAAARGLNGQYFRGMLLHVEHQR
jgi:RNA recognition motif-containing protein